MSGTIESTGPAIIPGTVTCPGCQLPFDSTALLDHAFATHPSMPVSALRVLLSDGGKAAAIADLQNQKTALANQSSAIQAQLDALSR